MNEGHGEGGWFKTLLICGAFGLLEKSRKPRISTSPIIHISYGENTM